MNILITGTGGLIGSYINRELRKISSFNVTALDRALVPDLSNPDAINVLKEFKNVDAVVHCAAAVPGKTVSNENAALINRKIDDNIFQYIQKGKKKILFLSSMSVYKNYGDNILLDESKTIKTTASDKGYITEKIRSEYLFNQIEGAIIFRVSSPYGLGQKNSNVLKIFIEQLKRNEDIIYFGTGHRTQDFIHGIDVANAVTCALKKDIGGVFNIVSGEPVTMKNLAELLVKLVPEYAGKIESNGIPDPQEDFRANFDNQKAKKILGWEPVIMLSEGLSELL